MNRRQLKKYINNTMASLYAECILLLDSGVVSRENTLDLIAKIYSTNYDFICRVSVNEGKEVKGRVHNYFKKLHTDFAKITETLKEKIVNLK